MTTKPPTGIADKVARISSLLNGCRTLLIVMQDYPDPDAIASAAGLRALANAVAGVQCSLAHGGTVGRAENRALSRYLDLNLHPMQAVDVSRFDAVALVDTQPGTGNNSFPDDFVPDIVIDHHPIRRATRRSPFTDVRGRYGATSTIIHEYLVQAGVPIDVDLTTALLYGIRSDTQDLGRETTQADIAAFLALYPRANKRMLSRIVHERVPDTYYQLLTRALAGADVYGTAIVAGLGFTEIPDMIGEVADLLLRREGTDWVLCYGTHDGKLLFSIRASQPGTDAGKIARRVAGRKGTAGGHNTFAAGQIPLTRGTRQELIDTRRTITARFKRAVAAPELRGKKLVKNVATVV